MQPLKQRKAPTSEAEAFGIDLLRAARASAPAPGAKQRVRARLLGRGLARRTSKLRPGMLVIGIVSIAGTSLAFAGDFLARSYQQLFEPESSSVQQAPRAKPGVSQRNSGFGSGASNVIAPAAPRAAASGLVPAPASQAASSIGSAEVPALASNDGVSKPGSDASRRSEVGGASAGARSPRDAVARKVTSADDTHLVFDAMRALRQEGQPDRASRLLDEYLRRFPRGPLAEEALALSIEAKIRTGDSRAKELSARYLSRFPAGRFRALAERAQARFSP